MSTATYHWVSHDVTQRKPFVLLLVAKSSSVMESAGTFAIARTTLNRQGTDKRPQKSNNMPEAHRKISRNVGGGIRKGVIL